MREYDSSSPTRPCLGAIWAQTDAGIIGRDGTMPWRAPEDLAHFKTVTMGYSLPSFISKKMKMEEFRVFISGENLWTFTNYSGLDPETVDIATGIDNGVAYPLARKISIGLTLKF